VCVMAVSWFIDCGCGVQIYKSSQRAAVPGECNQRPVQVIMLCSMLLGFFVPLAFRKENIEIIQPAITQNKGKKPHHVYSYLNLHVEDFGNGKRDQ